KNKGPSPHPNREQKKAAEICACRMRAKPSARPFCERNSGVRRPLERRSARVDQIIADVSRDFILCGFRQRERLVDRFLFRTLCPAGDFFPGAPATITPLKILSGRN